MTDAHWSDDRVTTLTSLWLDGLSASQIAKRIGGVTRNAVIGKVHRLGLSGRTAADVARKSAAPRRPRPPAARSPSPCSARPVVAFVELPEGPGLVFSLERVGAHCCRWPIGDPKSDSFSFCGRAAGDGPYCQVHDRVSHRDRAAPPLMADPFVRRILAGLAA